MSERAAPFYCPYCGDEDLRPSEAATGRAAGASWECAACNRAFALSFLGLLASGLPHHPGHDHPVHHRHSVWSGHHEGSRAI
ncbi:hypothetical protein E0L36_14605 [Streptomyces sp. AJS327]|uniref:hypothetical protein n=1 Tax=Streptomyces sp. AJS327 TaxID=2545265 RepID=UPI0015E00778|nr:hypothetical protein [Streptomyces sp. AJS327]MBA0052086.1 hypothetical protein [Streptomyces sp. AJS327]